MRETAEERLLLCGLRAIIQVYRGVSIKEYYGKRKNQSVADLVPRDIYGGTDRLHYVYLSQLTGKRCPVVRAQPGRHAAGQRRAGQGASRPAVGASDPQARALFRVCAGGLSADALHPRVHKAFCAPHELAAAGRHDNGADG